MWYIVGIGAAGAAVLCLVVLVARVFKKRLRNDRTPAPFTIQDLRDLRDRGDISQEEFNAMRNAVIGDLAGPAKTGAPTPMLDDADEQALPPESKHPED